jgi:hypothetical protein
VRMVNEKMRKESETGVASPLFDRLPLMFPHASDLKTHKKEGEVERGYPEPIYAFSTDFTLHST